MPLDSSSRIIFKLPSENSSRNLLSLKTEPNPNVSIFISLKMMNETTGETNNETSTANETAQNNSAENSSNATTTTTATENDLSEEDIQNIMKAQTDIIKEEMKKQQNAVKTELNKTSQEFSTKLSESTENIKNTVKKNHIKMKSALKKLEFQIKETSKQNDDIASIILSNEIEEQEKNIEELSQEINKFSSDPLLKEEKNNETNENNTCYSLKTCRECTNNNKCGWCSIQQSCVEGDSYGPLYEVCSFYSYQRCNDNDCNSYATCQECIANPLCGWCKDLAYDIEGCLNQNPETQVCPKAGWIQIGTKQNHCGITEKMVKSDFTSENPSKEEKYLIVAKKRENLMSKNKKLQEMKKDLTKMKADLEKLVNHYTYEDLYDEIYDYDEFEIDDLNKNISENCNSSSTNSSNQISNESQTTVQGKDIANEEGLSIYNFQVEQVQIF